MRKNPSVSVKMLAEYILADSHAKQDTLMRQMQTEFSYKLGYYENTKKMVKNFLVRKFKDDQVIIQEIQRLFDILKKDDLGKMQRQIISSDIDALKAFLDAYGEMGLQKFEFRNRDKKAVKTIIEGVEINLPLRMVTYAEENGRAVYGAVSLLASKSPEKHVKRNQLATWMTNIGWRVLCDAHGNDTDIKQSMCICIDLVQGHFISAKKSQKVNQKEIEAACRHIASGWKN